MSFDLTSALANLPNADLAHILLEVGDEDIIRSVCRYGPDDPTIIQYFLGLGAPLYTCWSTRPFYKASIYYAAFNGNVKQIQELVRVGVSVDFNDRKTVLSCVLKKLWNGSFYNNEDLVRSAICLIDLGAKYVPLSEEFMWIQEFVESKHATQHACIIILGLQRCCRNDNVLQGNGKDILRVIARCLWSLRGFNEKKSE